MAKIFVSNSPSNTQTFIRQMFTELVKEKERNKTDQTNQENEQVNPAYNFTENFIALTSIDLEQFKQFNGSQEQNKLHW